MTSIKDVNQILLNVIHEQIKCQLKYHYKSPNLHIMIGDLLTTIHIVPTSVNNPAYCLVSEESIQYHNRDFIVSIHITKEGYFDILGYCMPDDLEFNHGWQKPCYEIPRHKLKNINEIPNIIKEQQIPVE